MQLPHASQALHFKVELRQMCDYLIFAEVKDREVHPALHEDEDPELDLLNKGQGSTPSLEANF